MRAATLTAVSAFHLDAGFADDFGCGLNPQYRIAVELEIERNAGQGQRMAQGIRSLVFFAAMIPARRATANIPLADAPIADQAKCRRLHTNLSTGAGRWRGFRFRGDIDHPALPPCSSKCDNSGIALAPRESQTISRRIENRNATEEITPLRKMNHSMGAAVYSRHPREDFFLAQSEKNTLRFEIS